MSASAPPSGPAAGPGDFGIGSAAGGLGKQLADIIGGALGSAAGLVPDATALDGGVDLLDKPGGTDDTAVDTEVEEKTPADEEQAAEEDPEPEPTAQPDPTESDAPALDPQPDPQPEPAPTPPEPAPTPPEPVAEPPVAKPDSVSKTPCQIAADELPQVGD